MAAVMLAEVFIESDAALDCRWFRWRGLVRLALGLTCLDAPLRVGCGLCDAVAVIAGLHDVAAVREPVQERRRHLRSTNTLDHSAKSRLAVISTLVCSYMLVSLSVFLALSVWKPKSLNLKDYRSRTHPPVSLWALWISSCLFDAIKRSFSALDHEDLRALRVLALEWAALASVNLPG